MTDLLVPTERGLYCAAGDFHVDPWQPVERAVITHAHGDHARAGSRGFLTTHEGHGVLRQRMGAEARIRAVGWGETIDVNGVRVSLHPAGHILGSAQVRLEHRGQVWVVSGDYKTESDPTCTPFEPVRCHVFVTESTFGLPIYRWRPQQETFAEINAWWRANAAAGVTSLIFAYALGKAQRLIAGVDASIGPILVHGALVPLNDAYRAAGIALPKTEHATVSDGAGREQALLVAPPSAASSSWLRRFDPVAPAFASGWMRVRGIRRRRVNVDRGFVLSDHADWDGLLAAIAATGADRVWATHGYTRPLVRWLRGNGIDAQPIDTRFGGEDTDEEDVRGVNVNDGEAGPAGGDETLH
jgi:putative mRNA 3-end processing factor